MADLNHLADVLAAGGDPAEAGVRVTTVRRLEAPVAPPPMFGPAEVKSVRETVGVSQAVFARLLGASPGTVRAWEQGAKPPAPMARRLLAEVRDQPARWRAKLAAV